MREPLKSLQGLPPHFTFAVLLCLAPPAGQADDYAYITNNNAITITDYTGPGGDVTLPDTITGLPVATIGPYAFRDSTGLANVTMGSHVATIGNFAFLQCDSLTNVSMSNSVTRIGDYAFAECASLTRVTIPHSVTNIGEVPFLGCASLTAITVDTNNPTYSSMEGILFNKSHTILLQCPGGKAGSYSIPDSVTAIGNEAFSDCYSLTSVTIGNRVTHIGDWAFYWCSSLTDVTLPASVTTIGDYAFCYCLSLARVHFKGNAPGLGLHVFTGDNDAIVYYLPGTTGWDTTFGDRPTALWPPRVLTSDGSFGVLTNQFGFTLAWASGQVIVVEAATNLSHPSWTPVQTNTLTADSFYFSDPNWTDYPARFYRIRSP